jgi:hypothetical protein
MHYWGDEDFDWDSLNKVIDLFYTYLPLLGRICVHPKEKYGTLRLDFFHFLSSDTAFHSLIWPQYLCSRYTSKWRWKVKVNLPGFEDYYIPWSLWVDRYIFTEILVKTRLIKVFWAYQRLIFNIVTVIAVKKYKHIKDEILHELEFDDLLYKFVKKSIGYKSNWVKVGTKS